MSLMKTTKEMFRWDPFRELEEMSTRLNRLFREGAPGEFAGGGWMPAINVRETEKEYQVEAELPGMKKEDVHIRLDGRTLTITGERKRQEEKKGEHWHRTESSYGTFLRSFTLPEDAEDAKIDAKYDNGMLRVTIARDGTKKAAAGREIAIH